LVKNQRLQKSIRRRSKWAENVSAILETAGLTVLYGPLAKLFGWENEKEEKKVVINKDRTLATVRCLIHVIPVAAALALIALNASNYYIGGELSGPSGQDFEKLAALQFAAKLHELLMLASLGTMLITYIRRELAFGAGLPFGAVFSGLQFRDISFLWAPEMWGAIYQEWEKRSTKWFIISFMVLCTVLGVSVGPSTANLMKPRLDYWPAGGTSFWINSTQDVLFPLTLSDSPTLSHCTVDSGDLACPSGGWQVLNQLYLSYWPRLVDMGSMPEVIDLSSPFSIRDFTMRSRNTESDSMMIWGNAFTMATTSISAVADSLAELGRLWSDAAANGNIGQFKYRRDALFTTNAVQPLVWTSCRETSATSNSSVSLNFPALGNVSLSLGPGTADVLMSHAQIPYYVPWNDTNATNSVLSRLQTGMQPSILWIDEPTLLEESNSSLAAVFTLPGSNGGSPAGSSYYYCCSIDARMANVSLNSTRSFTKHVSGQPLNFDLYGTFFPHYPQITIAAEWAKYLTPTIPGTNASIVSTMASTAGIWNTTLPSEGDYWEIIVENIIAPLVANGIARASYNTSMIMNLNGAVDPNDLWQGGDWISDILPKNGRMGGAGNAFNISTADQSKATKFEMTASVDGYAYSGAGITQKAQMVVLGIYVLLALFHVIYSVRTGISSSSWGSGPEFTALAMNSEPASELKNTGAGIQTVEVFKSKVKVKARGDELQMMFDSNIKRSRHRRSVPSVDRPKSVQSVVENLYYG
jgi:hypothetical protein